MWLNSNRLAAMASRQRLATLLALAAASTTHALAAKRKPSKVKPSGPDYVQIEASKDVAWQCESVVAALKDGGVGVIPTDTGYAFCARVDAKDAVRRLLDIKGGSGKKPLSLLCRDLAAIDMYTRFQSKTIFKVLKKALPGPYTFVLPASENLPRVVLKKGKQQWKRTTVGVRVPDDAVCAAILEALDGEPLFCSSVPVSEDGDQLVCAGPMEEEAGWCSSVEFVVDAGARPIQGSTIYDLTEDVPVLVRERLGPAIPELDLAVA